MRFAAVQYDIAWMDKSRNWETINRLLASANLPRGGFALLPELCETGFTMDSHAACEGDGFGQTANFARAHGLWLQAGLAENPSAPFNAATIVAPDGGLRAHYRKLHLFSPGNEPLHYRAGDALQVARVESQAESWMVCPLICYDLRFPEVFRLAALAGAEVFTLGANWPAARAAHWRALVIARAIENQAYIVACNRIGHDPQIRYAGGSIIVAPSGEVLAEADDAEAVISADLDRAELRRWRDKFPALRDARRALLGNVRIADARG